MKKITFSCYEHDVIYILNCISLTKDVLTNCRQEVYEHYFRKDDYIIYMNDLTVMQKLIGYKANKVFYNFKDYDLFIGQTDYLTIGDRRFNFLFGKLHFDRLKEIAQEEKIRKKVKNIGKQQKNKIFTNFWNLRKNA